MVTLIAVKHIFYTFVFRQKCEKHDFTARKINIVYIFEMLTVKVKVILFL